jgi:WhiB family transcriptional regulator, redox-sensing transcriptional regulator
MLDWFEDDELEGEDLYEDTPPQEPKLSANEANQTAKTLAGQANTVWLMTGAGRELVTFADLFHRPEWQTREGCRGMSLNLFFPSTGMSPAAAKAVCAGCEVRVECLDAALADEATGGIWGGVGTKVRRQMWCGVKVQLPDLCSCTAVAQAWIRRPSSRTASEAIRALKRHISNAVYRQLLLDAR